MNDTHAAAMHDLRAALHLVDCGIDQDTAMRVVELLRADGRLRTPAEHARALRVALHTGAKP